MSGSTKYKRAWGQPRCVNGNKCSQQSRDHWQQFDHPASHPRIKDKDAVAPLPEPPQMNDMYVLHNWVGSTEAKSEYFLTPDDLRFLNYHSMGGGVGVGAPMKFYDPVELKAAAIRKHGDAGFASKRAARKKREANKRKREEAADDALAALATAPPVATDAGSDSNAAAPAQTIALRKSLLKLAKKALGFTDGGGPKNWRVEAPGIQPATFAALVGRPADAALATFPKNGAYHSHDGDACAIFGLRDDAELLRVFKREGVGIQISDCITLKYKPSDMSLALLGGGEIVCDHRTM
jgi:hypothetical protein